MGEISVPLQKETVHPAWSTAVTHTSRHIPVPNAVRRKITFD